MKLISPLTLVALAVTLSSSALLADDIVRRIDHPNGPATYVTARVDNREPSSWERRSGPTIGVLAGERSVGARERTTRVEAGSGDQDDRGNVVIHKGRGQTWHVPAQR